MSIIDYSWDFTKEEFSLDLDFFNEKEQEDKIWQAKTGLDMETLCGAIETIIFMNDRPINLMKIKNQIDPDLPLRVVHESIARLQEEYEQKHHGIRLMEVAQGYQFRTKATYSKLVQRMFKVESLQLSPTAVEVLAIIAYKQPISKTDVESIRGVDSSHIIRALMDRRLVRITGRSEEMGRPSLYGTTHEFLEVFNLNEITDLPSEIELDEIANANEIGEIADIKNIVANTDKEKFVFDEIEELDSLGSLIKDIAADTIFTKSLKDMDKKRVDAEGVEKKSAFDLLEEHVAKAQIIEQNKTSIESEALTTMMEPKPIPLDQLNELLNHPTESDEEFDIEIDMSDEIEEKLEQVLERSEDIINAVIEDPESALEMQAKEISDEIDAVFDELITEDEPSVEFSESEETVDEEEVETEAKVFEITDDISVESEKAALEMALDDAFDDLMGDDDNSEESIEAKEEDEDFDLEEFDLSKFEEEPIIEDRDSSQD